MQTKSPNRTPIVTSQELSAVLSEFRAGNRAAFRTIYDLFESKIYRFCKHVVSDEAVARDAFQECFIKAYEHREELHSDNVQSWLFTIARRVCLNQLRARRTVHDRFDEAAHTETTAIVSDVFLREHLDRALQQLPITLREAILLRDVEGHTYQEIAEIVGIDLSLAKVRVYRARLQMRKILQPVVTERQQLP